MVCKIYGSAIVGGILMALASHALAHPLKTAGNLYQHMALKTVTLKAKNPAKDTPKITATGLIRQGGFLVIKTQPHTALTYDGVTLQSDAMGRAFIGFHRDEPPSTTLTIQGVGDMVLRPKKRSYLVQRLKGIPQKYVEPPKATMNRIIRERTEKANAIAPMTPVQFYGKVWGLPLVNKKTDRKTGKQQDARKNPIPITGIYGSQRFYNGKPRNPHYGIDFAVPQGTPVVAPMDGTITLAKDLYFSGNTIYLDHGGGLFSAFLHLSKINVAVGDTITKGQKIGEVGSTGRSTGPHLDWRINWKHKRIDPAYIVGHVLQ